MSKSELYFFYPFSISLHSFLTDPTSSQICFSLFPPVFLFSDYLSPPLSFFLLLHVIRLIEEWAVFLFAVQSALCGMLVSITDRSWVSCWGDSRSRLSHYNLLARAFTDGQNRILLGRLNGFSSVVHKMQRPLAGEPL